MIKKFKILLFIIPILFSKSYAFSPDYEKKMYIGCYSNSKQYIGSEKAKKYCLCTLKKLNEKYNDEEINTVFKQKSEKIIEATKFASLFCEKEFN